MYLLGLIDFAAAVQGFLLGYFLLRRHGRSLQHRTLAGLVFAMSFVLLGAVLSLSGQHRQWPHLIRSVDPLVLLFGPLLYFHVHAATRGKLPKLAVLHVLPFVAYLLYSVPFYMQPGEKKIALIEQVMSTGLSPALGTLIIIRTAHMLCYTVISLALLRGFQRDLREVYSNVAERDLHRSVWFLHGYIAVTLGHLIIIATSMFLRVDLILANGIYGLLLGVCVYALAYVIWPHPVGGEALKPGPVAPAVKRPGRTVYHLSEDQFKVISSKMVAALEVEKAYLDGDLTIAQLSERMTVPTYQVSEAISRYYRSNFFDTVNRLRVEEAKRRLTDPGHAAYSIVAIAEDSGFNSKSSFNTAFKKHTGTTPSQFRMN
jgi:AraC-like DNA-binding protein